MTPPPHPRGPTDTGPFSHCRSCITLTFSTVSSCPDGDGFRVASESARRGWRSREVRWVAE